MAVKRGLAIVAGLFVLGVVPGRGEDHDECREQIQRLQERLDLLEAKLAVLAAAEPQGAAAIAGMVQTAELAQRRGREKQPVFPPELVPEIGKVGAEVGVVFSGSANPFHLDGGKDAAGYIDLPLTEISRGPRVLRGKLGYEIRIGLSEARTKFVTTSNVAQVANLAALTALQPQAAGQNVVDSLGGTGSAPFPVRSLTETRSKLLQVIPFSLKYAPAGLERFRMRPYVVAGFGMFVTLHRETANNGGLRMDAALSPETLGILKQAFGGSAPFGGVLVGGQLTQSAELTARGLPLGAGNVDFGLHVGGGVEFRVSRSVSFGFDARTNRISGGQSLTTFGPRAGVHF